jgi:hypothetical protein
MLQQKNKRIVFFCLSHFDYLADSLLIGLKQQAEIDVIEYGHNKVIYKSDETLRDQHGMAFTIGKVLDANLRNPYNNENLAKFDLFIFPSVQHQYKLIRQFLPYLTKQNTLIFDGSDSPALFPFSGAIIKDPKSWFYPFLFQRFHYYKREWINETSFFPQVTYFFPKFLTISLTRHTMLKRVSFSIPSEKIVDLLPEKTKLFPKHIVDEDLLPYIDGSQSKYAFQTEAEYYEDLQRSKFGVTTKRAGWDCMRHYEIAANGAVICFKDLDKKPDTCAPHGLVDGENCISYKNYGDLIEKINLLTNEKYLSLQIKSIQWINHQTSEQLVKYLLSSL